MTDMAKSELSRFTDAMRRVLSAKREDVEKAVPKSKKRAATVRPRRARPKAG